MYPITQGANSCFSIKWQLLRVGANKLVCKQISQGSQQPIMCNADAFHAYTVWHHNRKVLCSSEGCRIRSGCERVRVVCESGCIMRGEGGGLVYWGWEEIPQYCQPMGRVRGNDSSGRSLGLGGGGGGPQGFSVLHGSDLRDSSQRAWLTFLITWCFKSY